MAGKDKTTAWESVKWIKAHLPLWEKRGMSKGFLNSMVIPKYKGCSVDVESAISCEPDKFETLYNQPDFIQKLKDICKKYRMPYGKVPKEIEDKAEEETELIYPEFETVRPRRNDYGNEHDGITEEHLKKIGYSIENRVENKNELYNIVRTKQEKTVGDTGNKKLSFSPEKIELFIDVIERNLSLKDMINVFDLSETSIIRYLELLKVVGILKKTGYRKYDYIVNEDVVHYEGGRKHAKIVVDWDW